MPSSPLLRVFRDAHDDRRSIMVAVLTFRRPRDLAEILDGMVRLVPPRRTDVTLLVVDNDAGGSARATVGEFRERIANLRYVIEPRVGIPVARNRALREAQAAGADALCFIDDDEVPETDWLVRLVDAWRRSDADLVGGPVDVAPAPSTATLWQRLITVSLASRSRRKYARTAIAAASGRNYTIVTNNWLCDMRWLAASGLWFDERLLMTGGSDTAFFRAATGAGCTRWWAADAVVRETIPPERLTLRYQFRRGASQSITHFRMKHDRITPPVALATVAMSAVRAIAGIALLVVPIFGVGSLTVAVRSLGWAVGRLQALRGAESTLYAFAATPSSPDERIAAVSPAGRSSVKLDRAA